MRSVNIEGGCLIQHEDEQWELLQIRALERHTHSLLDTTLEFNLAKNPFLHFLQLTFKKQSFLNSGCNNNKEYSQVSVHILQYSFFSDLTVLDQLVFTDFMKHVTANWIQRQ